MAGWSDWYSGAMAPPLKVPGGYTPAPSLQAPMSIEEMYRGIYGGPSDLTTRTVQTVPVPMTVSTDARFGVGTGMRAAGSVDGRRKVEIPNPVYGPDPVPKYQDRLPAVPAGLPLKSDAPGFASARGQLGSGGFGSGSVTAVPRLPSSAQSDSVIDLSSLDLGDRGAQGMADSEGKPVRTKGGKVYYPGGKSPTPPHSGPTTQPSQGRAGGLLGMLFGNSGGGLFGGNRGASVAAGVVPVIGAAQAASAPAPTYTTTQDQQDRFQTVTGQQMPGATNNRRWSGDHY